MLDKGWAWDVHFYFDLMTVDREEEVSDDDDDNVTHNGDTDNHRIDKNWGPDTTQFLIIDMFSGADQA